MTSSSTSHKKYTTLVLDLGDVVMLWSPPTSAPLPPKSLRAMLSSSAWFAYEKGQICEEDCYSMLATEHNVSASDIRATLVGARKSLHPNDKFLSFIQGLRLKHQDLRIFAMSNIAKGDYEAIRDGLDSWNIFDGIYVSCNEGERKPHLGFYRNVISSADIFPRETIFVDDKAENVLSARSVGFTGIMFDDCDQVIRKIGNLLGDPVARGNFYLREHARTMESVTDSGVILRENFAQLLIMEVTNDLSLVNLQTVLTGAWNFFRDEDGSQTNFPFDLDTTAIAYSIVKYDDGSAACVMEDMLKYLDGDGIIQAYFDHNRPRIDPVVCTNVLTFFHSQGRGGELEKTFQWVYEVLENRAYLEGTRYYSTAECFLYFLMRFLKVALPMDPDGLKLQALGVLLKKRVSERIGIPGDSLSLAMRLMVCKYSDVENEVDREKLLDLQCEDGGWEIGWIYKYGRSGIEIGNRGLTTALAVEALR